MSTKQERRSTLSKSVINLSTLDYEKIAELQRKFDKFNTPKCALKVDREYSVAHILSNMEQEKIQELREKFEALNMKRGVKDQIKMPTPTVPQKKPPRNTLNMDDFRKVRESIEQNILIREMSILDRKRMEFSKKVSHIKSLHEVIHMEKKTIISAANTSYRDLFALPQTPAPKMECTLKPCTCREKDVPFKCSTLQLLKMLCSAKDENYANGSICSVESVFRKISKTFSGFYIWRIENTTVVPLPKDQYGTFYDKECYIIYAATSYGQSSGPQTVSQELRGNVEYHIHFWLGNATTADKAGLAAYKTVELDSYLGGSATQHREVQGKESPRLKCYFLHGMRILCGESNSDVRHLGSFSEPSLYRVNGNRAPVFTEMPDISWQHFNSKDVFLLHTKKTLFVWIGRSTNPIEKLHGTKAAVQLRKEYNTPNLVFVDDGYEKGLEDDDRDVFDAYLPLNSRQVKAADEAEEDSSERRHRTNLKLYQCCENFGKYRVTEIKTGPLKQEDLSHDDVIILDHGLNGIWVWVGKNANDKERLEAIRNARGFVKKKKYPSYTPVTRVVDGVEPIEFKTLFITWKDEESKVVIAPHKNKVAVVKVTRFDAITMHDRPALAAKCQLLDDGSGHMRMWRMKRFEPVELSKERFGIFFTSDCYVISYNYKITGGGVRWMIYHWMGYHSIADEQGVAALKAIEQDTSTASGKAMHARVWQGREPAHFLQLFKGRMRVFSGRGNDFDVSGKNLKTPSHYLLLIQGSATYNTRATQVQLKGSSLNSNYCFVLRKGNIYYIWCGSNSTGDNREMAKGFVGTDFMLLLEGNEGPDFWAALCGKHEYKSVKLPDITDSTMPPRLFQCSTNIEIITAEEILNFSQKDLSPEDVMLLDAHNTIYLWIGNLSTMEDQRLSFETAIEYLKTDPCGRDMQTPIIQLRQGFEPPTFTGFFVGWNDKLWKNHKSYEELRAEVETRTASSSTFINRIMSCSDSEFDKYNKYSVTVLRGPVENLPASVDPLKKELHLTYDDFVTIFCMEYKEFEKIPLWKQQDMKKQVGLF